MFGFSPQWVERTISAKQNPWVIAEFLLICWPVRFHNIDLLLGGLSLKQFNQLTWIQV
jgi:hypothetical protein